MSIRLALKNERKAELFGIWLQKAIDTNSPEVIQFARDVIFPEYLDCGRGWEPAKLDNKLVTFFEQVKHTSEGGVAETEGYGKCPDCVWFNQPEGCNVKRDSPTCLSNKQIRT
jgi:hypothetical protein